MDLNHNKGEFDPRETINANVSQRCDPVTQSAIISEVNISPHGDPLRAAPNIIFSASPHPHVAEGLDSTLSPSERAALGADDELVSSVDVIKKLGEGGMGVVYLANQSFPRRQIALKRLRDPSREYRGWLLKELHVTGQLSHPNIIPIYEVREHPSEGLEILMKRVEGHTLLSELEEGGLSPERLPHMLSIFVQVCHALEFAHSQGVIHRDVKCENIMIGAFGEVYLMDWGVALVLREAASAHRGVLGTPCYLAPEMLDGDPTLLTPLSDVYLLGATLHHALTGSYRHRATSLQDALHDARLSAPADYSRFAGVFPEGLAALMNSSCHIDPARRPQSVAELRAGLERALDDAKAMALCKEAAPFLQALREKLSAHAPRKSELGVLAAECESRARSALLVSPASVEALRLSDDGERALISVDLLRGSPEAAQLRVERLEERLGERLADPALLARVEEALERKASESRLLNLLNPAHSDEGRRRLLLTMTVGAAVISAGGVAYNHYLAHEVTTLRLLISKSVVFGVIVVGTLFGGRSLWETHTGAQVSRAVLIGSGLAFANSLVTHLHGGDAVGMMTVDMLIMGASFAHTEPLVPTGRWAALLCALCAATSILWPALTYPLLLISFSCAPLVALASWAPATRAK